MTTLKVLFTKDQVQTRIKEMASEIDKLYRSVSEPVLALCVLRGAVYFFADLTREMETRVHTEFVKMNSYGNATVSSGLVSFDLMPTCLENRHVLVVEDIIDTGHSMNELLTQIERQKPKSVHVVGLLNKQSRRVVDVTTHFIGFEIPDKFVVGMGMDLEQNHRDLPYIGHFTDEEDQPVQESGWGSYLPSFVRG